MIDTPEQTHVSERRAARRSSGSSGGLTKRMRRDLSEDFAGSLPSSADLDEAPSPRRRSAGVRLTFRGGLPVSMWGRISAGAALVLCAGVIAGVGILARNALLRDERFVIPSSSSILIQGNHHLTRSQLLSIFGEDVERNIFRISLAERRVDLERLPWVEHATVMRLLPNKMRVSITERTPVAFVRQGNHIGLVDAGGVLLDMPPDVPESEHYSFPVVTGITASDPLSTRAARMKIYGHFTSELDASGEKLSQRLSEVDLSNPEDIKALVPDHNAEVLVHFGDGAFLDRYRKYEQHLAEWRAQYPKLASVDMRYERQVVLEMQPGTAVPQAGPGSNVSDAVSGEGKDPGAGKATVINSGTHPLTHAKTAIAGAVGQKHAANAAGHGARYGAKITHGKSLARTTSVVRKPELVKPTARSAKYHPGQAVRP